MTLLEPAEIAIFSDGQRKVTDFGIQSSKMAYSLAPVDYSKYIHIILKIILRAVAKGQLISKCLFGVINSPRKRIKTIRLEAP